MHSDEHLIAILEKYDGWKRMGKIVYAGKVLSVQEAFRTQQWILPTQHAIQILREAHVFARFFTHAQVPRVLFLSVYFLLLIQQRGILQGAYKSET